MAKAAAKPAVKSTAKPAAKPVAKAVVAAKAAPHKKEVAKDVVAPKVVKKGAEKATAANAKTAVKIKSKDVVKDKPKIVAKATSKAATGKDAKPAAKNTSGREAAGVDESSNASEVADKPKTAPLKASVTINKPDSKTVTKPTKNSAKADKTPEVQEIKSGSAPAVSQTTDAAVLAAIDTSGYVLPGVKVPGRRGRKPKEYQPENEEIAALNAVERAEMKAIDKAKAKDRKAKEKALLKDAFSADTEATEEELERRRQKLKTLIKMGKDSGYLTSLKSMITCLRTWWIQKRSKASSVHSTTWAWRCMNRHPMQKPCCCPTMLSSHQ